MISSSSSPSFSSYVDVDYICLSTPNNYFMIIVTSQYLHVYDHYAVERYNQCVVSIQIINTACR